METADLVQKTVPPTQAKINSPEDWRNNGIEYDE